MSRKSQVYTKTATFVEDFDKSQEIDFDFVIERVLFRNNETFTMAASKILWNSHRVLFPQNKTVVSGKISDPKIGDRFTTSGVIQYNSKYGYSIKITKPIEPYIPRTRSEMIDFLSDKIDGIGKLKATKIVDFFGEETLRILSQDPERVKEVDTPITVKSLESIKAVLGNGVVLDKLFALLNAMGSAEKYAYPLFDKFGSKAYDQLVENPYEISEINPLLWRVSDKFYYQQLQKNKNNPNMEVYSMLDARIRTAVKYYLKLKLELSGSLALNIQDLESVFVDGSFLSRLSSFGTIGSKISKRKLQIILSELEQEQEVYFAKTSSGERFIYLQQSYLAETKIVNLLKRFVKNNFEISSREDKESYLKSYENRNGFSLASRQKDAVDLLANNRISILTGGPGSGKTTTVKAVKEFIDYLVENEKLKDGRVALLAPTGKAAKRMSEVLGVQASTIHRKLKLKGFGIEENPITIDEPFVIVDEASMIDVYLFSELLSSLSENTNLLLVGDENQLPSVGAGLILRDLIESKKVPTIVLNKVFRQEEGSRLVYNAHAIKDGLGIGRENGPIFNEKKNDGGLGDTFFIRTSSTERTKKQVIESYKKLLSRGVDFRDLLVLTATNGGDLGTINLNHQIQRSCFPRSDSDPVLIRKRDNSAFYIGDPVIQLINDYDNNVFNGETGVVIDIKILPNGSKSMDVCFESESLDEEDRVVTYSGFKVYDINLAYAITIHKSQGSESKAVIMVADSIHSRSLNRSLIYTGYTRTKELNLIIGQEDTFNEAIANTSNLERVSLVKERLNH